MSKRRRRCKGKTKLGKRCKAWPLHDGAYCLAHADEETRGKAGFGGPQPGSGKPRLPRPHEVLREKLEGEIERWLKPYEDGLEAMRGIVVDGGLEFVPDHKARMQAVREPLDRVYGKPKQQLEIGGSETPISAEIVAVDAREAADAAHDFLRRVAGGARPED